MTGFLDVITKTLENSAANANKSIKKFLIKNNKLYFDPSLRKG